MGEKEYCRGVCLKDIRFIDTKKIDTYYNFDNSEKDFIKGMTEMLNILKIPYELKEGRYYAIKTSNEPLLSTSKAVSCIINAERALKEQFKAKNLDQFEGMEYAIDKLFGLIINRDKLGNFYLGVKFTPPIMNDGHYNTVKKTVSYSDYKNLYEHSNCTKGKYENGKIEIYLTSEALAYVEEKARIIEEKTKESEQKMIEKTVLYKDYKNKYSDYRTKKDSYNSADKTIIIYVPEV